jgi:23S rRNA (uracil1939-C5)-methyltransferase
LILFEGDWMNKVSIYALDYKGRGIGRLDDKPIFIFNALVGETVKFLVGKERSKYLVGKLLAYDNTSIKRVKPNCPFFSICGGCDIMHMTYDEQLKFKEEKVKSALKKIAPLNSINSIVYDTNYKYRNKVIFKVDEHIGFYEKETHNVVDVNNCLLITDGMNNILNVLKENISTSVLDEVMIREGKYTNEIMLYLKVKKNNFDFSVLNSFVTTLIIDDGNINILKGNGFIHEKLDKFIYKISPSSFFQVNTDGATKLYSIVKEFINENDRVLDLYCGTGSIGIFISDKAQKIYGVEINSEAIKDANSNKKINNLTNIEFECLNTSLFNRKLNDIDCVIVDPPRSGLDKHTKKHLIKEQVPRIIYVSCDLMTLKRDLEEFSEFYSIKSVTPVDLFPNTYHCESVVILERK